MKKILTILAASAMFFAFGDDINNGINFESYSKIGEDSFPGNATAEDPVTGGQYWYSESYVGNVISNHPGMVAPVLPSGITAPDLFKDDNSNTNFLYLETEKPLFRTVAINKHSVSNFTGVSITENPIYLDTLVKFTAADSAFTSFEDAADKIAIEYVEHEEESHEENEQTIIDSVGFTNFVIRAGYLSSPLSQTNYYAAVPANFDKDAWHRLTVRSFGSIDESGSVGFVVYLDGVPLEYDTNVDAGPGFTPSGAAAAFYTSSLHALFPSAVQSGGNKSTLSAVAFSGNGSVDDLVFTTEMPKFIKDGEAVRTEITLGTGISSVIVKVGEGDEEREINPEDATATPLIYNLPAGTTNFTLVVTADTENGYSFAGLDGATYEDGDVTWTTATPSFTVLAKRDNAYYMDGETKVGFATLTEAFASAPENATIKLGYNYSVADNETTSPILPVYTITNNLVLDLNGKTLDGGSSNARFLFSTGTDITLTVIDSVSGDTGKIIYGGSWGIFGGDGDAYLGSNDLTDYGPVIDGAICGEQGWVSGVVRGKFKASDNTGTIDPDTYQVTDPDGFVSEYMLEQGSSSALNGDYWVVSTGAQPQPTTYALTIPTVTGASATVTDKATSSVIADLTAIEDGTVVTVTWTPESGYKITAGDTEEITMDGNKTAGTPTVVAITYATLTITPVENCTIVVSNATEEVATGATFDVDAAVELTVYRTPAEGYELDNCAATETITMDQDQTVTAAVKQSGGKAYPSYIEGDTAKDKYDAWAEYAGISAADFPDASGANKDAYLLNCKTDEVVAAKAAFKFTSISYDATQSKWVTTTTEYYNNSEKPYNGTVVVKQYSDVGCNNESSTGTFFKAFLQ